MGSLPNGTVYVLNGFIQFGQFQISTESKLNRMEPHMCAFSTLPVPSVRFHASADVFLEEGWTTQLPRLSEMLPFRPWPKRKTIQPFLLEQEYCTLLQFQLSRRLQHHYARLSLYEIWRLIEYLFIPLSTAGSGALPYSSVSPFPSISVVSIFFKLAPAHHVRKVA